VIKTDFSPSPLDVQKELAGLSVALQKKAVRTGLIAAIKPIKADAKAGAPFKSGALAHAIGHKSVSESAKKRLGIKSPVALLIGANRKMLGRNQARKGLWHEYGTKRMAANPFLAPALANNEAGIEGRFYQGLSKHLDKLRGSLAK